jgi:hypothetical protein
MKTDKSILIIVAALMLAFFYSCDTVNTTEQEISEEELEIAGEIIAESLSEQRGGFLSSVYDAFSQVEQDGIRYSASQEGAAKSTASTAGRGSESEYNAEYNPETGEHIISFRRSFQGPFLTKTLSVLNKYIFMDAHGEFLQFPQRQQDQVQTIDFKGTRTGTASTERRSSSFTRTDTLFTTGISSESAILMLEGNHHGSGEMSANLRRVNRSMERSYQVHFEFQNIEVDKATVRENGNLEEGITGVISYRLKMTNTVNGDTREQTLSGIVELTGDGTALLRFERIQETFLIALRNGTISL